MKKLNFKIAVLLCMMMGFSSVVFGQVPSDCTIVKTHNDDITWYEVRGYRIKCISAFYNDKEICYSDKENSIFYSHGYFFCRPSGGYDWYYVYDKQGNKVERNGSSIIIDEYEEINGRLYMFKSGCVYDEHFNEIASGKDDFLRIGNNVYLINKENKKYGIRDLTNDRQIVPTQFTRIDILNGTKGEMFFKLWSNSKAGIHDISGEEILAPDFQNCDYLGNNLFSFKMNGYWGVMDRQGKIIIPLDRHYTSIAYSRTLKTFTFTKETETAYFDGECNASGVQTSIEKTGTKSKPKQQTQQSKQETKPQQPKQEQNPKVEPKPEPKPEPIPPQPRPMQVWKPCPYCQGTGKCHVCLGDGHPLQNPTGCCITCNGTGKCSHCAGNGGQNVIEYH